LHQYATGRPDENDGNQLTEFGNQISEKAGSGNESTPSIPGNRPYKESSAGLIPKENVSLSYTIA
jgi:hypothetical protein